MTIIPQPITPKQAAQSKEVHPDMINAVNSLIKKYIRNGEAKFTQDELIKRFEAANDKEISRDQIFDDHMLDFEGIYEQAGWKVIYDKPGYNESYDATFTFKAKK